MKALVLCAGRGTRLRPLTHTRAKAALPVAGSPVLTHILRYLWRHGFTDVGVVLSRGQGELKRIPPVAPGQRLTFILQTQLHGIAHAVQTAANFLGNEPFLLYLGDNLTDEDLTPALHRFQVEAPDALITVRRVSNPDSFGVAELDGDRVVRVVEKPLVPISNLAIAGIYLFQPSIHAAITGLKRSARGEYEITDAIGALVASGRRVVAHSISAWWQDMGTPAGMLMANSLLLDQIATQIDPSVDLSTVEIQGRVVIGPGTVLQRVRLRGPLCLGANCRIEDAYIGPYTSVGEGAQIRSASVEHSILLHRCRLVGPSFHLEDCLLGRGAVVEVKSGRTVTVLMGDDGRLQVPPFLL